MTSCQRSFQKTSENPVISHSHLQSCDVQPLTVTDLVSGSLNRQVKQHCDLCPTSSVLEVPCFREKATERKSHAKTGEKALCDIHWDPTALSGTKHLSPSFSADKKSDLCIV